MDMPHNTHVAFPWRQILSGLWVISYLILGALGLYSLAEWAEMGPGVTATLGLWAAAPVALFGIMAAVAKAAGWWQVEWVALWFLMSGLVIHASLEARAGDLAWLAAETFFLLTCAHRNVSLYLFARDARWGVDRRHMILDRFRHTERGAP